MSSTSIAGNADRSARRPRRRSGRSLVVLPVVLVLLVAAAAMALIAYVLWPRWPSAAIAPDAPTLPITVAGVAFNVPPAAIRVPVQRRPGAHERVDLVFLWPSLELPDPNAKPAAPTQGTVPPPAPTLQRIFMTIASAGDTLAPADRAMTIYPRYTAAEAETGPGDLTVLAFRADTPYQGEDLDLRCDRAGLPGALHSQRRGAYSRHLPLRAADRRRRPRGALPARLARRLARGHGQHRPADRAPAGAARLSKPSTPSLPGLTRQSITFRKCPSKSSEVDGPPGQARG